MTILINAGERRQLKLLDSFFLPELKLRGFQTRRSFT